MKAELLLGKVLRPRGLSGELKAELYIDKSDSLAYSLLEVRIDGKAYPVDKLSVEGAFAYMRLKGVSTAESAESLRGKLIYASRNMLPPLSEGEYYIADLIGISVYAGDERLGILTDVSSYGAADVYTVKREQGTVSFPALKKVIASVDITSGVMRLDRDAFASVAVYNT